VVSKSTSIQGDLLVLGAAMIWGVAFYFQKTAMDHIGPMLFVGLRGAVAALALLPLAWPTVTNTGFLTAIYVVLTPFLYWIIKRRSPSKLTWLAVVLAFFGVWGLSGGAIQNFSTGDLLVAGSSIFWALLLITTGESSKWSRPLTYTCIQFSVVAFLGLNSAVVFETVDWASIKSSGVSILYVGLLSTAFTFALMAYALKRIPAPRASILLSTETLFAAAAGYLLLGERLTLLAWVGAMLILAAVVVLTQDRSD